VTRRSIKRRRALIAIGALAFGASGAVASGAFSTGSQGSLGDNWIQIAGTDQAITFESPQQNVEDSSEGQESGEDGSEEGSEGVSGGNNGDDGGNNGDDGGNNGDDGGDNSDDPLTSQFEVIVDPTEDNIVDPSGAPLADGTLIPWPGSMHETSLTRGTENGLLLGIASDKVNPKAVTQYGTFDSTTPGDDVAFIIANGGSADSDISLPPVDVTMQLYAGDRRIESNQIRFPYRVLDSDRNVVATGNDLTDPSEGSIDLATGEIIEVIIEFDTTESSADLKILSGIRFFANGGSN